MLDICPADTGQFWDPSKTWYTESPRLSRCFRQTGLVWAPCLVAVLHVALALPGLLHPQRRRKLIWTLSGVCRPLFGTLALAVKLGQVVWEASSEESLRWGALSAGGLLCLSLAAVVGLLLGELSLGGELSPYLSFFAVLPLLLHSAVEAAAQGLEDTGSPAFALDVGTFVLLCLCFFCLAFRLESEESRAADDVAAPEPFRSGLNRLTLDWLTPLVRLGYKRPLEQADTFRVPPAYEAKAAHETLEANLAREFLPVVTALRTGEAGAKAWMSRCIAKTYGWQLFTSGVLNMSAELMGYMEPLFLKFIINFAKSTDEPTWHGGAYVAGIFSAMLVRNLMTQHYYLILNKMGILMNTGFITAVYRKSLRICPAAKSKFTVGEIVNLMSVDAQRMGDVADILHMCWTCPLQITVAMVFLYYEVGVAAFAGAAVYVAMLPFNGVLAHFFDKYQEKQMEEKDNRIKVLTELLNGIKLLKLYAWEPAFLKKLNGIRSAEVGWLRKNALIGGFLDFGWTVSSILAAALTFVTYVALGHTVDAERIFVSFALFDKVNMPLTLLPMAVSYILMLRVSLRRLAAFFAAKELQEGAVDDLPPHENLALRLQDACFSWGKGSRQTLPGAKAEDNEDADATTEPEAPTEGEEEPLVLRNISLKAKRGALVAVVGRVGAGKSSLLSALCGELDRVSGSAAVSPALAYVPQSAWIQNMTLRDNVLFGQPFSESRYSKVVKACALEQDLQILQHGDQTEIGERGINLSGGQKARVSLARAVYRSERDLYLLDDPLSALDVHVGKQIFSEVLGPEGLLKDTCRVLVTHALWVLAKCDWVVCLGDGGVVREQGEYGALLGKGGAFAALIRDFLAEAPDEDIVDLDEAALKQLSSSPTIRETLHKRRSRITSQRSEDSHATPKSFSQDAVLEHLSSPVGSPPKRLTSQSPQLLSRESSRVAKSPEPPQETVSDKANLIDEEEVHVGRVSWSVYWSYISQGGVYFVLYFIFQWLAEGCWSSASIWLQIWADGSERPGPNGTTLNATISAETGVAVFSALAAGQAVFSIVLRVCYALGFIRASRRIHDWLTSAIFRAPMAFFDTTPTGRIVNRCGKDLEVVDDQLPAAFDQVFICFIWTVETCVQTVYALPLFAIVMVPILLLFLLILRLYVTTSRQLRRLQSVSRSPVYSTFQETLQGTTSIRAYGAEERFVRHSEALVDENNRAYYCIIASNRWLGFRLSLISSVLATAAASFILYAKVSGGEISPGKAGLGMGNALQFMGILSYFVRQVARLETEIVAVERIREYAQTTAEADWDPPKGSLPPPPNWPPNGGIVFDNYALRYRPGLDLALRGIDCAVEGGSKVGIVGRTGAGKSSLASGLFRLIEAAQGEIRIDGQPIQLLGLHQLRRGLSIIPQDPLVFSGSMRQNLDPHGRLSDGELWAALELAHLKDFAKGLPGGLSHEVAEGGSDLSQGQRQLLCLARALLRKAKVLVLDEATGAVDVETDALVQRTLREAFPTATILTIAHRLNTIMNSDRILVLEQGKVAEWDTPAALLADPHSRFAAMAREAGVALS